ncbi:hypothetical protein EFA69_12820 [Rufibacter immobilis]|uniref:Thoeris protein ThsB TIR-like domain-containing protein n=1 Tax=Rufibacter immobilis TaxID=1348778 RepID=A0A3M9MTS4_9BACT|nr:TIR domain-containing protein [Rufibacter immobilis]RNI28922.1 hypothetical protein EFA69_12820 [Rufibacter immobilis]
MKKRVFVSFAMEDEAIKTLFCGHAKNTRVPYEFVDMSVKVPWDNSWKTNCRTRIRGCDAMIVLVSENTRNASGALWEIKCGKEEGLKMLGIYIKNGNMNNRPVELWGTLCKSWGWENVSSFIDSL